MTPEEKQIEIAEACGWTDCKIIGGLAWFGIPPNETNRDDNYRQIPDYFRDRNVIDQAIRSLSQAQQLVFADNLNNLLSAFWEDYYEVWYSPQGFSSGMLKLILATPEQMAEAFWSTIRYR